MALVAQLFPLLEESRYFWTWRASTVFSILLRLDTECTSPKFGPLCWDLSLKRSFRGFLDLQMPRGWANPRLTAWPWSIECYTTWFALSFYHEADIEMRSPIMRHSSLTRFWVGNGSTWGTWWWCTWSHVAKVGHTYSPMVASSPECSRMPTLIWVERDFEAPRAYDTYDD